MTGKSKFLFLAIALAVLITGVNAAQLTVSVYPKDPGLEILKLYPDEVGVLEITVSNSGEEAVENVNISISVKDTSLVLFEDFISKQVVSQQIALIEPGAAKTILVNVKPREFSKENQPFVVRYGAEILTHSVVTYVGVVESPLDVQVRLAKSALDIGEGSKVVVTLKNKGQSNISDVEAELVVPRGFESKSDRIIIDLLAEGESLVDREFEFKVDPIVSGQQRILLLVSFVDENGKHAIERELFVDVQNRAMVLQIIIIAIVVLIIIALYLKRNPNREEKPLEAPEVKEIKGETVETLPSDKEILK